MTMTNSRFCLEITRCYSEEIWVSHETIKSEVFILNLIQYTLPHLLFFFLSALMRYCLSLVYILLKSCH